VLTVRGEEFMRKTIFIVDDIDTNLIIAKEALKDQYRVMTLPSAAKMFLMLEKITPDLILLDIEMPEMNGFEALTLLKQSSLYAGIPVIFLTGMSDPELEVRGFQLGVIDFILKPFSEPVLRNRIKTHMGIDELIRERTAQLHEKTEQLQLLQKSIVFVLSDMVENRDKNTGGHIERTAAYLQILMDAMMVRGVYKDEIRKMDLDIMISSARLHDVGKITISDSILNKPEKLTDEEIAIMKSHATEGERIVDQIVERAKEGGGEFLRNAKLFACSHHERWDGTGYPRGLAGTDIPLQGRLMAIADVYDALVSERPYKKPFTPDTAVKIIMENAGTQFEPAIAEVFYEVRDKFEAVNIMQ
jgi:putative two-component system response regulator